MTSNIENEPALKPTWVQTLTVGRRPRYTLIRIAILLVTSLVVFNFILLPIRVTGISMSPTYKDRSINFVDSLAYVHREPKRGDVVGIRFAGKHFLLMKRIVGVPGETVGFSRGHIIINGNVLSEPYEKWDCDWNVPPVTLGAGVYFVVGDNRTMPAEDHVFGEVARDRIIGKVLL